MEGPVISASRIALCFPHGSCLPQAGSGRGICRRRPAADNGNDLLILLSGCAFTLKSCCFAHCFAGSAIHPWVSPKCGYTVRSLIDLSPAREELQPAERESNIFAHCYYNPKCGGGSIQGNTCDIHSYSSFHQSAKARQRETVRTLLVERIIIHSALLYPLLTKVCAEQARLGAAKQCEGASQILASSPYTEPSSSRRTIFEAILFRPKISIYPCNFGNRVFRAFNCGEKDMPKKRADNRNQPRAARLRCIRAYVCIANPITEGRSGTRQPEKRRISFH